LGDDITVYRDEWSRRGCNEEVFLASGVRQTPEKICECNQDGESAADARRPMALW
jgi:hypothetical protein